MFASKESLHVGNLTTFICPGILKLSLSDGTLRELRWCCGMSTSRTDKSGLIKREKERPSITQVCQALTDSLAFAKQPRKPREPKPKGCAPSRQSERLASQVRPDYKEADVFAEDRLVLSRLKASGFVMASSKTRPPTLPAKPLAHDSSLMSVFRKSSYFEAVSEPKLRLVEETMEEGG